MAAQKDNKIVVSATAYTTTTAPHEWAAIRITTSGKADKTFDGDGMVEFDPSNLEDGSTGVAIQSTGRIILVGHDDNSNTYIVGINPNGSQAFNTISDWSSAFAEGPSNVIVDSSDRIIVIGHSNPNENSEEGYSDQEFAVQRLSASGVFEWSKFVDFATPDHGRDDYAYAAGIGGDGNIIVVGESSYTDSGEGEQVAIASIQGKSGGPGDAIPVTFANGGDTIIVNGTGSADNIRITPTDRSQVFVDFNGNIDHYFLGGTDIVVNGNGGNDRIELAAPVDYGNVTLNGGSGNDTLIGSRNTNSPIGSTETFIGGSGTDTADYSARTDNLNISLDNKANDGATGEHDNVMADVENVTGGSGNDKIVGNPFNNVLKGGGGNDTLYGGAGNDTLDGGSGRDMLFGQDANDTLLAKDGRVDSLDGGNGLDTAQRDNSSTIKDSVMNIESFI
jgi:Ca2+-binding RTX toxin-like protein